jgi:hypothetical protein
MGCAIAAELAGLVPEFGLVVLVLRAVRTVTVTLSIIHHWHLMTKHDLLAFFDAHIHDLEQLNQDGSDPGISAQLLVLKKKRSAMTPLGALPDKIIIHICHSCNLPATPRPPPKLLHQTCQLPRYLYNSSQPLAINPGN